MVHKKKPFKKEELLIKLGIVEDPKKKKPVKQYAKECFQKDLISLDECQAMGGLSTTTIKRYLYSVVDNRQLRTVIDDYVNCYSKIYCIGSRVINAFFTKMYLEGKLTATHLKKDFLDQTAMKYFMLPFKSELTGGNACVCKCEEFNIFWKEYSSVFRPCYPTKQELGVVAWDQPLTTMVDKVTTAFKTHMSFHFPKRFKKYIMVRIKKDFALEDGEKTIDGVKRFIMTNESTTIFTKKLVQLINRGVTTTDHDEAKEVQDSKLPAAIVDFVIEEREYLGLASGDNLEKLEESRNLNSEMIVMHTRMSIFFEANNIKSFSIFPVADIGRTFCYIDQRVLDNLFRKNKIRGESDLKIVFKLTNKLWKKTGLAVRKKVKQCPKSRKERKRLGIGRLPKGAIVKSVMTDGVALCINAYYDDGTHATEEKYTIPDDAHTISSDDGRVNLHESVQFDTEKQEYVSTRLTAKRYQKASLIIHCRDIEDQYRKDNPEYKEIVEKLSAHSWRTCNFEKFMSTCEAYKADDPLWVKHNFLNKDRAFRKMLMWRRKNAVMTQSYVATIRKCKSAQNKHIVFSVGNGNTKSTGKKGREKERHGGVPTNWKHKILVRLMKAIKVAFTFMIVDEHLTTRMCHKCHHRMKDKYDAEGKAVRGLKCCTHCAEKGNPFKLRNRDLNAAINILVVTKALLAGEDRPVYLRHSKNRVKRSVNT